jgi:Cof subfamily protein (haloacid dehalogenase superfamily)
MIKLIFIDVDGTLLGSSGTVHPEVWDAAERAREHGVHLAICSGRPAFGTTRDYAQRLDPEGWHVFQNGASAVHLPSGRSLSGRLASETVDMLVRRARSTGRVLELYTDTEYAVESTAERARLHAGLLGVPFAPRSFESLAGPVVRAQWLLTREEAPAVLAEPHPGIELSPSTSPVMPETIFVNMTPTGVNKASAVRAVAAAYEVPLDCVMFVGDGHNDVAAMREVGVPVAMANAEPEVHAVARYAVPHVDDVGLVEAITLALTGDESLLRSCG